MTMKFTRYLYNQDEVKLTLLENLLNQKNLKECYFWIYEYYKSTYVDETFNFIYKIYYDFYGLKNPKFEKKINYNISKNQNFAFARTRAGKRILECLHTK